MTVFHCLALAGVAGALASTLGPRSMFLRQLWSLSHPLTDCKNIPVGSVVTQGRNTL